MDDRVAESFLSMGIQSWGQTAEQSKKATDAYLRAAGFELERDRAAANEWLDGVKRNMRWGKFETEVEQLKAALEQRKAA